MYQEGESSTNQSKGKSLVLDLNQNCSMDLSYDLVESEAEVDTPAVITMGFSICEIKPNSIDLNYPPIEDDTCKVIENRPIAPAYAMPMTKDLLTSFLKENSAAGIQSTIKEQAGIDIQSIDQKIAPVHPHYSAHLLGLKVASVNYKPNNASCELLEIQKKVTKRPKDYVKNLSFDDIAKYFDRPSAEASACLKIGESLLKKKCREFDLRKWPYRKIKSLDNLIRNIQEEVACLEPLDKASRDEALKRQQILESERELLKKKPVFEIKSETKKLRQYIYRKKHQAKWADNTPLAMQSYPGMQRKEKETLPASSASGGK